MNRSTLTSLVGVLLLAMIWAGCSENEGLFGPADNGAGQGLAKRSAVPPGIEAKPQFRVATGKGRERLTVFVFYEKGGKGGGGGGGGGGKGKPPKDDGGGASCDDPNTNQAHAALGVEWPARSIPAVYNPTFEPDGVAGQSFAAVDKAFSTWEAVTGDLVALTQDANAPLVPTRDNSNVVGWRQLVGKDAKRILGATYIWDDGNGTILEADILYNLAQKWAVNASINPGDTTCGINFDVQAIGAHEIGHFIGLGHVFDDGDGGNGDETDATMAPTAAKGELKKQTLTPGDGTGANAVAP